MLAQCDAYTGHGNQLRSATAANRKEFLRTHYIHCHVCSSLNRKCRASIYCDDSSFGDQPKWDTTKETSRTHSSRRTLRVLKEFDLMLEKTPCGELGLPQYLILLPYCEVQKNGIVLISSFLPSMLRAAVSPTNQVDVQWIDGSKTSKTCNVSICGEVKLLNPN